MKMPQIVYVLVSSSNDIYLEQAYVSIESARFHMPDADISVLVDEETKQSLTGDRATRLSKANKVINIGRLDGYTPQERSRIIKTSVRKYIKGDFLYIDTDTIICKPFADFENFQYDIAACEDSHSSFQDNPYRNMCLTHGKILGWPIEEVKTYHNSGVLFVKDTPLAHEFYKRWNQNWIKGRDLGVTMDQPSFAKTNFEMNCVVGKLDDVWNCEILHGTKFIKDAYILHYLCTNKSKCNDTPIFILKDYNILKSIKQTGKIPSKVLRCFSDPFVGIPQLTLLLSGNDIKVQSDPFVQFAICKVGSRLSRYLMVLVDCNI